MNVKEMAVKTTNKVTSMFGRAGLKIRKYSPEILIVAGTASVITGVVLCCKATLKAEEVLDKHDKEMDQIEKAVMVVDSNGTHEYTENDRRRDTVVVYGHTFLGFVKLYAPGVGFTLLGIGCFLGSYGILKKRNVAIMAAYKALETTFGDYRKRVIDELGEEMDKHFMYGTEKLPENAEVDSKEQHDLPVVSNYTPSQYARFFDETCTEWTRSNETNKMTLIARERWANELLNSRGHVFLNEVYDMLGMQRSKEGTVVGWVKNNPNGGDNYISFGIFDANRPKARDFVNGFEYSILLDFNVDGIIWDMI